LVERRRDLRGKTSVETGLRWAKLTFGELVGDKHKIFIVPHELNLVSKNTKSFMEKGVYSKEGYLGWLSRLN
jgi:hypothetical protein